MTHVPTVTTTHDATSWNVHRATLVEHSHVVDEIAYVGGRGQRLAALLTRSYAEEARNLAGDLCDLLRALPADIAGPLLADFKGPLEAAASGRHDLRSVVDTGVGGSLGDDIPVPPDLSDTGPHRLDYLAGERDPDIGNLAAVEPVDELGPADELEPASDG